MSALDGHFGVDLDEPFAVTANPGCGGVVAAGEVAVAASGLAGCGIGENGDVGRDHAELMVAKLKIGERAGVEIVHDLLARLDGLFHVKEVRKQKSVEGGEIVILKGPPEIDLLDEDEVWFGRDGVLGGGGLGECWGQRRGEHSENEE